MIHSIERIRKMRLTKFFKMNMVRFTDSQIHRFTDSQIHDKTNFSALNLDIKDRDLCNMHKSRSFFINVSLSGLTRQSQ